MRSSLRKETKGGRCVAMWAPLGHPLTTSWEVKDIQEERSLKELKMGLFNQPEGFPLRPKKEKMSYIH